MPFVVGLADRQAADDQRLALLDLDEDLVLAGFMP